MGVTNKNGLLPNFLIVGAPRCGTTSLYHYLSQHPQIYMSPIKEPTYLASKFMKFPHKGKGDDAWDETVVTDLRDYRDLFQDAGEANRRGEASPTYLYFHDRVIPVIKELLGDIPIIIMLRNPVDRAFSAYMLLKRLGREELEFEEALAVEEQRVALNYCFIWLYTKVGFYTNHVKAYLENFSNVGVFFYEDFQNDPQRVTQDVYRFLSVDSGFTPNLRVYNASGLPRNIQSYKWITESNRIKSWLKPVVDMIYPEHRRMHVIEGWKSRLVTKPSMKLETKMKLKAMYKDEIRELQELLKIDLTDWLEIEHA